MAVRDIFRGEEITSDYQSFDGDADRKLHSRQSKSHQTDLVPLYRAARDVARYDRRSTGRPPTGLT